MSTILNAENAYKTKTPQQEVNKQFVHTNTDVNLLATQTFTEPYCKNHLRDTTSWRLEEVHTSITTAIYTSTNVS